MKTAAIAFVLVALLAGAIAAMVVAWRAVAVEIPLIGWIAIAAGGVISVLLGAGLMMLSFYSARAGYDDRQTTDDF